MTPASVARVGGKAVNLALLERAGARVPPWYAVTTEAFDHALSAGLDERIRERLSGEERGAVQDLNRAAADIRQWIRELELPADVMDAVRRVHSRTLPEGAFVAVRSSATAEDTATDSFAGLHDSFLFIREWDRIVEAVKKVWASAYNDRALAYRRSRDIPLDRIAVGVLVQQMVDAEISGVMFTVNPSSGDLHELVISSLYGAGEGLVSAGFAADTFIVRKESLDIEPSVVEKPEQLLLDDEQGHGLKKAEVPEGKRLLPSLGDGRLLELARTGMSIELACRRPQDIEFCIDRAGGLFILQTRPVTTVQEDGPAAGNRRIWDNSNIIESYSGVTSPMTFSFIRHAYTIVYHCFADVMGVNRRRVHQSRRTFENMLGLFRGQVYYNLNNWYALIRLFPGFQFNKKFMESMMGVRESLGDDGDEAGPGRARRYFVELPALLRLVARSAWNFIHIRKRVGDFEDMFRRHYDRWTAMDFDALQPHELKLLYEEMEEKLLWNWKAPIINDFFVMIFYGTLKKLCSAWCGDEAGSLQNDLMCGEGGIESTKPTRTLLELAARADRQTALRELLLREPPEKLVTMVPEDPRFADFAASIGRYLGLYGFRCVNELKLEEPSLKDRPDFLYQVLRNYLSVEDKSALDVRAAEEREQRIRREAEQRAFARLGGGLIPRRTIFRWVLRNARLGVKNRENMRFARTRIYGLFREMLLALGRRLAAEGVIGRRDDIFFLTLDEVWDFIQGTAVTTDLRGLIEVRRAEFEEYRSDDEKAPDDRFETYGMAYHRNLFRSRQASRGEVEDGVLRGIGCCPGEVTAPVKYVRSPNEDASLSGEILVADRTDPGWVPLYPSVSGLLIERGSVLSHSAIVAREMGIPTVVGIPGLTSALRTGQLVTMDGSAGTVRLEGDWATAESSPE